MIVTAVERKRRRRRVEVFVDGEFAIELGVELAAERGVRPGRVLTTDELRALTEDEGRRSAMVAGLRLLSYRPRGVHELRDRLRRKGFGERTVDETLRRLRAMGYLDDEAFARMWTETRQARSPRSAGLAASELRLRGIAPGTARRATEGISDEEAAYAAAGRRMKALRDLEYEPFRERLGRFLSRRGFTYDVARVTIERCWADLGHEHPEHAGS